tara:strand:- start:2980 stop:4914 length:1935 start_codon:yes stop_codon:yes gene_type:complete
VENEQVYYRKWRPKTFSDVVGQPVVVKILSQSIQQGRVSHAYLFTGPRGTGKTSMARILAKSINCLSTVAGEPCNSCDICEDANNGNLVDVIEIDAASKGLVDDIRDLKEQVYSHPYKAKNKVYIIDEAHMLTPQACNAFLKILEEPPKHIVFILCTTELLKIPATIVSRCQKYDFRRIALGDLMDKLSNVSVEEGVQIEKEALRTISRAASGSLRDAENILEQLVTYKGNIVSVEDVRSILGLTPEERAFALVKHILYRNTNSALELVNAIASEGIDLRIFLNQVIEYLRTIMLIKSKAETFHEHTGELIQELTLLANNAKMSDLVVTLQTFGEITIRPENPLPLPIELAIVSATFSENQAKEQPAVVEKPVNTKVQNLVKAKPSQPLKELDGQLEVVADETKDEQPADTENSSAKKEPVEDETPEIYAGEDDDRHAEKNLSPETMKNQEDNDKFVDETDERERNTAEEHEISEKPTETITSSETSDYNLSTTPVTQDGNDNRDKNSDETPTTSGYLTEANALDSTNWGKVVKELSRHKGKKYNFGALLRDVGNQFIDNKQLILQFKHSSLMEKMEEELQYKENEMQVIGILKQYWQEVERLVLEGPPEGSAVRLNKTSSLVQAALGLGGRIVTSEQTTPDSE